MVLLLLLSASLGLPEGTAHHGLLREARMQMPCNEAQCSLPVVLQVSDEVAELFGINQRLGLVHPLTLGECLGQLVRDDAAEHQVVQAAGQLATHYLGEVVRDLQDRSTRDCRAQWPDRVLWHVEHRRALHKNLADAVALYVVVLHLLRREGVHPVDERSLLDGVHGRFKVEAAVGCRRLEMAEVEIWKSETVLCAGKHAGVDELVLVDLPLGQYRFEVHPVNRLAHEVHVYDDPGDVVQEQARRAKYSVDDALLGEVRHLRTSKVRRLEHLAPPVPQVVEYEVHEVAVNAAGGHGKALGGLALLAQRQMRPRPLHLLVHAADEHGVLRPRRHALEDKHRADLVPLEKVELLVDKAEYPGGYASQSIREGVLQRLYRSEPVDGVDADAQTPQRFELDRVDEVLLGQVGVEVADAHPRLPLPDEGRATGWIPNAAPIRAAVSKNVP
mmetsp:Transcript_31589/g.71811  ORF Transcript_31589/g.71811 Transcript_31589/m.71811 type:complete len:445 (+) Transcript_31589:1139-2473(+)